MLFHHLDRVFKVWEKRGSRANSRGRHPPSGALDSGRARAITEGLGAIYPAMMYFIMALDALDYPQDHPDRVEAIRHFESLLIETRRPLHFPAVRVADLGHGDLRFRTGRSRRERRSRA